MKRLFASSAVAAILVGGLMSSSAAAGPPQQLPDETVNFTATNPCTGEPHDVSITLSSRVVANRNTVVLQTKTSGATSDGFEIRNGRESGTFSFVGRIGRSSFVDNWVNPITGQKFRASGVFVGVFDGDPPVPPFFGAPTEVRVDRFSLTCVGGPTILPD